MRLPDAQTIKRSTPPSRARAKSPPPAVTQRDGNGAGKGAGAGTSGGTTGGTQADLLAHRRTRLDVTLDKPTTVSTLLAEPTLIQRLGGGERATGGVVVAAAGTGDVRPTALSGSDDGAAGSDDASGDEALAEQVATYDVSDAETTQILTDLETLRTGDQEARVQAVFSLAQSLQPEEIGELTESLDIDDDAIVQLLTDTDAIGAVATLVDPDATAADKVSATITLAESTGDLASGSLERALERPLSAISAGQELISLVQTFRDPDASPLARAEATLAFVTAAKDSIAGLSSTLGHDLGRLDSLTNSVSAALTLLDPDASNGDRAEAAATLFANVPEVRDDLGRLSQDLVDRVVGRHAPIAFDVPDSLAQKLDPEVLASLTPEQLHSIGELGDELAGTGANAADNILHDALSRLDDPGSVDELLTLLEEAPDTANRRALAETFAGLRPGVLDGLLADGGRGASALADVVAGLDDEGRVALRAVVGAFDAEAIDVLTRLGGQVDPATLQNFLKVADDLPGRELGQALKFLDGTLRAAGVVLTPDTAGRIFRNLGKLIPAVGAVPALYDVGRLGEIALDTNLPDDIRYLALSGTQLNIADVASSVAEPIIGITGIPIAVDVAIGVSALAVDLIVADQITKFEQAEAAGVEYEAPAWLTTANVATAAAQGPAGWTAFFGIYGADDGVKALGVAAATGGTLAIDAAEGLLTLGAEGIGEGLETTAEGLHLLADIIRNPAVHGERAEELGRAAVERLGEVADGVSDLAEAAHEELVGLAGDLRELGEDGLEALGWIAANPGEAAEIAVEAIGHIAGEALELGTEAGKRVAAAALATLDTVIEAGGRAAEVAKDVIDDVVGTLKELGREGIETLGWIASNPSEAAGIARDALRDVAVQGGELAEVAYEQVIELGEDGLELAKDITRELIELGEDGIDTLAFIASHPGEAAEIAIDGLKSFAEGVGEVAERAATRIVELAESGIAVATETLETLLLEGSEAVSNVLVTLGEEIGPGVTAVIDGLADLGDAGRDALIALADAGLDFALDGLSRARDAIADAGSWAWNATGGRVVDGIGDAWNWATGD